MLKNRRSKLISAGVVILVLVIAFFVWSSGRGIPQIKFSEIVLGEVAPPVSCSGVVASEFADLSSRLGGRITWLGVDVGAYVKAGDVLVKFDNFDSAKREYDGISSLYAQGLASKNQLDSAKAQLEASGLISPINGVVVKKTLRVGEVASPGYPVVAVANTASPWVDVEIDEMDIGSVREGAEARIFCDAYQDDVFYGRVSWISRAAEKKEKVSLASEDEDKIFKSKVVLLNSGGKLKPGMTVDVDIITQKKTDILISPREAILAKDSKNVVFVLNGGRVSERTVEIGLKDLSNVEITKGLKLGEKVAIILVDKLKNRMKVNAVK